MVEEFEEVLIRGLQEISVSYGDSEIKKLLRYKDMLLFWNERVNLTAIKDSKEVAIKHFIDSLASMSYVPFKKGRSLIDVGTGAGFPGIPLKIFLPKIKMTLLDSLQKRCNFLQEVVKEIHLEEVKVVHGRAEDRGKETDLRERFDFACARAVTNLPVLLEYALPFVRVGGLFIAFKGPAVKEEVLASEKSLSTLGGRVQELKYFKLPVSGEERSLVIVEKVKRTPETYPRRAGLPEKKPLQ